MILNKDIASVTDLNSSPSTFNAEVNIFRDDCVYKDLSHKFKCNDRNFSRQYAHIYAGRLNAMQPSLKKSSISKWGNEVPIRKLSELTEINEQCIIIGTLFKHQELKPSILKEISEENHLVPQPVITNYVSVNDQLILEDEMQRIRLIGNIDVNKFVSGIVMAVKGIENKDGNFEVNDYVFGTLDVDVDRPCFSNDSYVLMISGLNVEDSANMLSVQLLVDWIVGELGCPYDQMEQGKVIRVIIAGDSIKNLYETSKSDSDDQKFSLSGIKLLDDLVLNLVKSVPVDIMPGAYDPSNHTLPQQCIHHSMFPKSSCYQTLHPVTNPYECMVQGRRILGASGQPVNDIRSLTDIEDDLTILECTLRWNHIAPTAPDTIACYPYYEEDPFIITKQPDVYFTGNVSSFGTKTITMNDRPVCLVCVPSFSATQTCALINLKTLECQPLCFKLYGENE